MALSQHAPQSPTWIVDCIVEARAGSTEALDRLMEFTRQYLLLIANDELPADLQGKEGASDLVQDTQFEAARGFASFRGQTAGELLAWLRQILLNNVRDFTRRFSGAAKRHIGREMPLDDADSGPGIFAQLVTEPSSPSNALQREEQAAALTRAVAELPSDYRQVIEWHHREGQSFEQIADRLGRSVDAVRKLWSRAIQQLRDKLRQ